MTFILNSSAKLEKELSELVRVILKREKKDDVADLPNLDRVNQLQLLIQLTPKVKAAQPPQGYAKEPAAADKDQYVSYGAMLTTIQMITERHSTVRDGLGKAMGIKEDAAPDAYQKYLCYKHLLRHLSKLYKNSQSQNADSRAGLNPDHPLMKAIDKAYLRAFIEKARELQTESYIEALHSFKKIEDAKKKVKPESFLSVTEQDSIRGTQKSWEELSEKVKDMREDELAAKNVAAPHQLVAARAKQLEFIRIIREMLASSPIDDTEKSAILLGALYIVRADIRRDYKAVDLLGHESLKAGGGWLANPKTHEDINDLLKEISPNNTELDLTCISACKDFLFAYGVSINDKEKVIHQKTPFSPAPHFDLIDYLSLAHQMVNTCHVTILNREMDKVVLQEEKIKRKEEKAKAAHDAKSGKGMLSSLASLWRKAPAASSDDETDTEEDEHEDTAAATPTAKA